MFGSNFDANFGIPQQPQFPFQGADSQGGLFGPNAMPDPNASPDTSGAAPPAAPAVPPTGAGPAEPVAPHPTLSPLGGGPLSTGSQPPAPQSPQTSPATSAAAIGSPFGRSPA